MVENLVLNGFLNVKKNHRHNCGCESNRPGDPNAGFKRLFNDYKASAKKRNHEFKLTKEQFKKFIDDNCYYCKKSPQVRYDKQVACQFLANGIDRVDNNIGYIFENCVTACKFCNLAKKNMTMEDFKKQILDLYNTLKEKGIF